MCLSLPPRACPMIRLLRSKPIVVVFVFNIQAHRPVTIIADAVLLSTAEKWTNVMSLYSGREVWLWSAASATGTSVTTWRHCIAIGNTWQPLPLLLHYCHWPFPEQCIKQQLRTRWDGNNTTSSICDIISSHVFIPESVYWSIFIPTCCWRMGVYGRSLTDAKVLMNWILLR